MWADFTNWSELKVEETVEGSSLQFSHFFAHPSSMVHENLGYETDCLLLLRVMPGISDQARNGLQPHCSLRGSHFGFSVSEREKRRRRVRAWGRGWEGTACNPLLHRPFPTPIIIIFCSPSHVSYVLLACVANGIFR